MPSANDAGRGNQPRYTTSDVDYEKKYAPDAYGEEMSSKARVWSVYNDETQIVDGERVKALNGTLDVLLVFAGLFSAVVTTFVAQSSQALNPDYTQITASLVYELVRMQRAAAVGSNNPVPMSQLSFGSKTSERNDLWVNGLWLVSLTLSLLTALFSVLAKQWIQHYNSLSAGSPRDRAILRQYRINGFERWKVPSIVGFLPGLLTAALLLFLAGLAVYVAPMDSTIFAITLGISTTAIILYAATIALPIFVPHCAYKTPMSDYVVSCARFLYQQTEVFIDFLDDLFDCGLLGSWEADGPHNKSFELSDARRRADKLMLDVLNWLTISSLNASAARISAQAMSALMPSYRSSYLLFLCYHRSIEILQELNRDCATSVLTSEHMALAERLARVVFHREIYRLDDDFWRLSLWDHLYTHRNQLDSFALKAILCIVLWSRFCHDRKLAYSAAVRRALGACSMLDLALQKAELHPLVWRMLERMAHHVCLHLCDADDARPGSSHAINCYIGAIFARQDDQYAPPENEKFPESTAMTLEEYCKGCNWPEGCDEILANLEKLKRVLSERLAELVASERADAGRVGDTSGRALESLHEDGAGATQVEDLGEGPSRHDAGDNFEAGAGNSSEIRDG
ncbi:hypothetical protein EV121DRAFT_216006, partial [Schizophyllum commune]